MKTNRTGYKSLEHSKSVSLPRIKQESSQQAVSPNAHKSLLSKHEKRDDVTPDSNDMIENWFSRMPEPNKHVQFVQTGNNNDEKPRRVAIGRTNSLHYNNQQHFNQSNLNSAYSFQSENDFKDVLSTRDEAHVPTVSQPKLYRSLSTKTSSISNLSSASTTVTPIDHHTTSVDNFVSLTNSKKIQSHQSNLSFLEFNSLLSECVKKKLNDIRVQAPDEFEELLPTLFKLGVVLWPKKLFDKKEKITVKELKQRENLIAIVEFEQQDSQRQRYLHNSYGNVLPSDDILHKYRLLRENLSFQGQLCLLEAYRDEIENELAKKCPDWSSIPMNPIRTDYKNQGNMISCSSIIANSCRVKNKFFQSISLSKFKSTPNISSARIDESFTSTLPDQMDNQWSKKLLAKIIEQGMNILDQIRKFSRSSSLNRNEATELKDSDIVRKFKRWFFLWSILYINEQF